MYIFKLVSVSLPSKEPVAEVGTERREWGSLFPDIMSSAGAGSDVNCFYLDQGDNLEVSRVCIE